MLGEPVPLGLCCDALPQLGGLFQAATGVGSLELKTTEGMLWDDVGIVAGEDYRLQLYASLGYDVTGERAASPEIGN